MPDAAGGLSIEVDRELCTGSGVCIAYAPATFAHDAETKAVVVDPSGDAPSEIRSAAEGCPTGAITVKQKEKE